MLSIICCTKPGVQAEEDEEEEEEEEEDY